MSKLALILSDDPTTCMLPTGRRESVSFARTCGYVPKTQAELDMIESVAAEKAAKSWGKIEDATFVRNDLAQLRGELYRLQVFSLPEAKERPRSAAMIIGAHNAKSMPVEKAALFLRNLPIEGKPTAAKPAGLSLRERTEAALADAQARAKFDRRAEDRAVSLQRAIRCADRGTPLDRAIDLCNVDPRSL